MRKVLAALLILALLIPVLPVQAEETAAGELDLSDLAGVPTHYRRYDAAVFEAEDEQPGTVVKMKYTTEKYDKPYKKTLNVYLPYGYDENGTERYPVLYFFHGRGCNPDTLIGNPQTKNAFDHMISSGLVRPFILVSPTYYYDMRKQLVDYDRFVLEMREEIMPLVEGTYRTWAQTPDEAGFRASREQRAISGFSMGSFTTWNLFGSMLDVSATFLPFSGAFSLIEGGETTLDSIRGTIDAVEGDYFIYMACGGEEDLAFEGCSALAREMRGDEEYFSYGTQRGSSHFYYVQSDNIHQDLTSRYYLYNAFLDGVLWPAPPAQE
ncbi:MAG: hypothetical protein IKH77_03545 [Clostridia bacterium]|nr:hypothetical protein [Clostridia bacterium]